MTNRTAAPAGFSQLLQIPRVAAAGTVDAITATFSPAITLTDQMIVAVVGAGANTTTTPTFAPNGLTARTITARGGGALVAGDIGAAGFVMLLEYNLANTRWELMNPVTTKGGVSAIFTGTLTGLNLEVFKTATADSPLTAAQCAGTIVSNFGMTDADCTIALPTAVSGYSFLVILPAVRAHFFKLQADTNDKIYLSGVAGADAGKVGVASGYATGVCCSFYTFKASDGGFDWFANPVFGTWVAS